MNNTLNLVRFVTILVRYAAKTKEPNIRISGSTHKPSVRHDPSDLLAYVRLGGTEAINQNLYCGMLRHNIIIDLYGPKTNPNNVEEIFSLKSVVIEQFPYWQEYMKKAGTNFENRLDNNDGKDYYDGKDLDDLKKLVKNMAGPFDTKEHKETSRKRFETLINFDKHDDPDVEEEYHDKVDAGYLSDHTQEELAAIYKETGPYQLASNYLENSGLYTMQDYSGVGIELFFSVDEKINNGSSAFNVL